MIYLDNAATTKVDKKVLKAMLPYFSKKYANASSIHSFGQAAKEALESSREKIAKKLNADPEEIFFTSGGTESNNFAIKGAAWALKEKGKHIITSKLEHESVLSAYKWLESNGFEATYINPDKYGIISPEKVQQAMREDTILVSIMHANNEIGTIQPIREISKICREKGALFHSDGCQSFMKEKIDSKMDGDLFTINAHKLYGPKGVGALFIRKGVRIAPLLHGGGHEKNMRSGTENIPGIVGFAAATDTLDENEVERIRDLRKKLEKDVLGIEGTILNGHPEKRLCSISNISFKHIEGESLLLRLDGKGIMCSTGSACSSHTLEPSHVLVSCGVPIELAHSSIRFSLGKDNTEEDISKTFSVLEEEVKKLRELSPFGK